MLAVNRSWPVRSLGHINVLYVILIYIAPPVAFKEVLKICAVAERAFVSLRRRASSGDAVENGIARAFEFDALETVLVGDTQYVAFACWNTWVSQPLVSAAFYVL